MQCQPIDSASMNLEGLRWFHVGGVKRTCDPVLTAIQAGLRFIIANTAAGGLFFAGGYDGGPPPVDAILEARKFIDDAIPKEQHSSLYKVCTEIADGDVILAATRMCPRGQSAIEKCTCMTAGSLDEAYTSVALEYARELSMTYGGEVEWKCTKTVRGIGLKARQFGLAKSAGHGAIEEYPVGDGRYIADLAVFDAAGGKLIKVVEVVGTAKATSKATSKATTTPSPPPMFSVDDEED
ncbi:hypothetical protein T492DRAFT_917543 [Pavlovales sp. CCMP2436]|nr:hypothetical protein T492DRAFT_917543 [Pavlovales sp. CCMP2436]